MRSKNPKSLVAGAALAALLSKGNHTLAIVDPKTLQVIARAPVGPDPHEVIASSDGKTAYISIYGGGRYHALSVIDLVGQKALPDIDTGALNGPHGLVFVGGKVWFTAEGAKVVASYDPASAKIDWIMGRPEPDAHDLRHPGREANLHNQRKLRDGQHPGKSHSATDGTSSVNAHVTGVTTIAGFTE
jgi:hypothetical protein